MTPKPMTREKLQTMRTIALDQLDLALRLKRIRRTSLNELELVTLWLNDVRRISLLEAPSAEVCLYAKTTLYRCIGRLSRIESEAPPSLIARLREQFLRLIESWRALQTAVNSARALTVRRASR